MSNSGVIEWIIMGYLWELIILLHHNMMGGLTMAMMGQEFKEVQ